MRRTRRRRCERYASWTHCLRPRRARQRASCAAGCGASTGRDALWSPASSACHASNERGHVIREASKSRGARARDHRPPKPRRNRRFGAGRDATARHRIDRRSRAKASVAAPALRIIQGRRASCRFIAGVLFACSFSSSRHRRCRARRGRQARCRVGCGRVIAGRGMRTARARRRWRGRPHRARFPLIKCQHFTTALSEACPPVAMPTGGSISSRIKRACRALYDPTNSSIAAMFRSPSP